MKAWLVVMALLLPFSPALAGNETHGGDIVVCQGKDPVVLDYYHAALKGFGETTPKLVDISGWTREEVIAFFQKQLRKYVIGWELGKALRKFGDMSQWAEADLKDVDDSDEPYFLPKDCERKQGAIRQGNQVYVDPTFVAKLSSAQQGILVVHEALFYIANLHNVRTSVHVRELIRGVLRTDTTEERLFPPIHSLGSIAYVFEALPDRAFRPVSGSSPEIYFFVTSAAERKIRARLRGQSVDPAELECDETGLKCTITKPIPGTTSALSWKGATMEIQDGTRRIAFNGTEASYWTEYSPSFAVPEASRR